MKNRVKEILSSEVLALIKQKETEGYGRYELVSVLVYKKDVPSDEILKAYQGRLEESEDINEHSAAYKNMLIEAIMMGIRLKEEIAAMQELKEKAQEERED